MPPMTERPSDRAIAQAVRWASDDATAALALLSRMRFACGDNGLRMQDELEQYLVELRRDAERWRTLREMDGGSIYALLGDCDGVHGEQADAAIDAAIDSARGSGS